MGEGDSFSSGLTPYTPVVFIPLSSNDTLNFSIEFVVVRRCGSSRDDILASSWPTAGNISKTLRITSHTPSRIFNRSSYDQAWDHITAYFQFYLRISPNKSCLEMYSIKAILKVTYCLSIWSVRIYCRAQLSSIGNSNRKFLHRWIRRNRRSRRSWRSNYFH